MSDRKVIYIKNNCWWEFDGTLERSKRVPGSAGHRYFTGVFGPLALKAQDRPYNYTRLSPQEQWDIDKSLGILDWDGEPTT